MRYALVTVCVAAGLAVQRGTPPPDTEIFLATLSTSGATITIGEPANITNSPGYDNQPSFTPDGQQILFTSARGGTQTDIYRYDIASRAIARVTDTPESEYSPTVTPDGRHISVIRVEADGTQRLWRFTADGKQPELVLTDVKPVGYHAWADERTLVLFVLGTPATLQVADTESGKADVLVRGIGRSLQRSARTPGRAGTGGAAAITFVERQEPSERGRAPILRIRELEPKGRHVTPLVAAVEGATEADLAWTPDGVLLMAHNDLLYGWRRGPSTSSGPSRATSRDGDREWRRLADLAALGLHGVTRLAVSPNGDRIAFVTKAP